MKTEPKLLLEMGSWRFFVIATRVLDERVKVGSVGDFADDVCKMFGYARWFHYTRCHGGRTIEPTPRLTTTPRDRTTR